MKLVINSIYSQFMMHGQKNIKLLLVFLLVGKYSHTFSCFWFSLQGYV